MRTAGDPYESFADLCAGEPADAFSIVVKDRGARVLVLAIHGGAIEKGTSEIAHAIAADDFNLYCFEGRKASRNAALHITSHRFDEPIALALVAKSEVVLSIHGCRGREPLSYIGGADTALALRTGAALHSAGFIVARYTEPMLLGASPRNICNRAPIGRLQLELSRAQRDVLLAESGARRAYAAAVRGAADAAG